MPQTVPRVRLLGNSQGQPTNTVIGLHGPRPRLRQGGTMRCWRALPIGLALLSILYAGCGRDAGGTAESMETTGDPLLPVCRVEEVFFVSGGNRLAGMLYVPPSNRPHPALAMVLGSGPRDRSYGGAGPALGGHFAAHGYACLVWDKPGVGQSKGDYNLQ